jgi:hypothetical protein
MQDLKDSGYPPEQTCLWTEVGVGSDKRRHIVAPLAKVLVLSDP